MFPLKRGWGVAHSFDCTHAFVVMRLADALVNYLIIFVAENVLSVFAVSNESA